MANLKRYKDIIDVYIEKSINIRACDLYWILGLFILNRVVLSGMSTYVLLNGEPSSPWWLSEPIYETRKITVPLTDKFSQILLNGWYRWDTGYYLKIAALGYDANDGSTAFGPLYPLLIRLVNPLTGGNYLLTSILISNIFCLLSLLLIYKVANLELNSHQASRRVVFYTLAFPTAFYLFVGYPESLFLAFILLTWLFAQSERWLFAGLMASLATLTRFQGILLMIMLCWLVISKTDAPKREAPFNEIRRVLKLSINLTGIKQILRAKRLEEWFACILPGLVLAGYQLWMKSAELNIMITTYKNFWSNPLILPWRSFSLIFRRMQFGNLIYMDWANLITFVIFLILGITSFFMISPPLSIYSNVTLLLTAWISLGILYTHPNDGEILVSFIRYSLTLFPLFIVLAKFGEHKWLNYLVLTTFFSLQLFFVWLFLQWYWVA